jgi:hypothetical protein
MHSRQAIETILFDELERRKQVMRQVRKHFCEVALDVPSLLPDPVETQRIRNAREMDASARNDFLVALREFNDFILRDELPERFKDAKDASSGL